jgi:hypothetical protein
MEFFIRQGSSSPILKMRMVDDAKNDKSSFNDLLENSNITFEMFDTKTNQYYILNGTCNVTNRIKKYSNVSDEYYIVYQFTEDQTSQVGRYEGKINIEFLDISGNTTNKLILPIREKLFINVI